jgi:hypothetical protein
VQSIFGGWVDADGFTIDLFFSGLADDGNSSTNNVDTGLFGVGHRGPSDNAFLVGVRDDTVRFNFRNDGSGTVTYNWQTAPLGLLASETYRVTIRQHKDLNSGNPELYLDDLNGNVYNGPTLVSTNFSGGTLPANFVFNFPLENPTTGSVLPRALNMTIGSRYPFHNPSGASVANGTTELRNGGAIDQVRIYNGAHTPAEIGVPEPSSLCLVALAMFVPSLVRRR